MKKIKEKIVSEKKLIYWIENLKLGLKYRIKLENEKEIEFKRTGVNAEMYQSLGRISAYEEVINDLDKVLGIK